MNYGMSVYIKISCECCGSDTTFEINKLNNKAICACKDCSATVDLELTKVEVGIKNSDEVNHG